MTVDRLWFQFCNYTSLKKHNYHYIIAQICKINTVTIIKVTV